MDPNHRVSRRNDEPANVCRTSAETPHECPSHCLSPSCLRLKALVLCWGTFTEKRLKRLGGHLFYNQAFKAPGGRSALQCLCVCVCARLLHSFRLLSYGSDHTDIVLNTSHPSSVLRLPEASVQMRAMWKSFSPFPLIFPPTTPNIDWVSDLWMVPGWNGKLYPHDLWTRWSSVKAWVCWLNPAAVA